MSDNRSLTQDALFLKGLKAFANFPQDHLWMLVVDARLYAKENGPQEFEKREDGSVAGVLSALATALIKCPKGLSLELFKELNFKCLDPIKNKTSLMRPGKLRDHSAKIPVATNCASMEGIKVIYDKKTTFPGFYSDNHKNSLITGWAVVAPIGLTRDPVSGKPAGNYLAADFEFPNVIFANSPPEKVEEHLKKIEKAITNNWGLVFKPPNLATSTDTAIFEFMVTTLVRTMMVEGFSKELNKARTDDERIDVIAQFGLDAMRLHPFSDGNNREFINTVMNVLLLMNGMLPCIYEQPNIFECMDVPRLRAIIKKGQALTQQLIDHPNSEVLGYSNKALPAEFREKFSQTSQSLMTVVKGLIAKLTPANEAKEVKTNPSPHVANSMFNEGKEAPSIHTKILDQTTQFGLNTPEQKSVLEAVKAQDYGLALRRACAYKLDKQASLILDHYETLKFDINSKSSKNNFTALDWLEKDYSTNMASVKAKLLSYGALSGLSKVSIPPPK